MNPSQSLFFTAQDLWLRRDETTVTLGLTDFGQGELGELVFAELPAPGAAVRPQSAFGVVELVKATAELFSPVSGTVVEINDAVAQEPGLVNESPYERGWLVRVQFNLPFPTDLMDAARYGAFRPHSSLPTSSLPTAVSPIS